MINRCTTPLTACLLVALLSASLPTVAARASQPAPEEVQDLRYGVILYHFFQQSYFDALTESLVGEQRTDLAFHQQSAKLLRGGMSLSYGMGQQAEDIFLELLDNLQTPAQRDRAWFYLAKLYYLRGDDKRAQQVLDTIGEALPASFQEEFHAMSANILLRQGDAVAADRQIAQLPASSPWRGYYLFNRGSRQTLAGDWQQGISTFKQMEAIDLNNEEGLSLRDRSYIAAGFAYLGGGDYAAAINEFLAVRLDSPLVEKAMLGYGWAAAQQQDFETALAPWQALSQRSVMDASVQESLLAIPFAYEKLDAKASALQEYQRAISVFEQELSNIDAAIQVFSDLPLVDVIADEQGLSGNWMLAKDYLPINDQAPYLSHLIAQQHFQAAVKNLNDLVTLQQYLQQATVRLQALQGVLDFQQQVWQSNLGQSQREAYRQRYKQLLAMQQQLQQQQKVAEQQRHGRYFLTAQETELWQLASHARGLLEQLQQADYDLAEEQQQLQFYQGLLQWQVSEQESSRRWTFKKQLSALDEALQETRQRLQRLEALDDNRYDARFASRVELMQQRLARQQSQLQQALQQSETEIRQLAIAELSGQQQRLGFYLAQAKLAVARLYDVGSAERQP